MATIQEKNGLIEFTDTSGLDSSLTNEDLLPTSIQNRTWNKWHISSLWVGMSVCIPTYMLAASMIKGGLSWKESLMMILLGNIIVSIPMVFNGHAGTKYGIPFPVLGRASFGNKGIHIPSILRALVACGWFGIQTWLGGLALVGIYSAVTGTKGFNDSWNAQFVGFMVFWLIQMFFVWKGTESIKWLETLAAPILILVGLGMLYWGVSNAGGLGNILNSSYEFQKDPVKLIQQKNRNILMNLNLIKNGEGKIRAQKIRMIWIHPTTPDILQKGHESLQKESFSPLSSFKKEWSMKDIGTKTFALVQFQGAKQKHKSSVLQVPIEHHLTLEEKEKNTSWPWMKYLFWLTAMVAFWATLALNIPDITRYAKSQKDQVIGQFLGLPTTMVLYSFIGVAVTCASVIIFKDILIFADAPWDPVRLIDRFQGSPVLSIVAQLSILLATLSTNIAANVISPANSFANLAPKTISFKMGGLITGVVGIIIMPWKLLGAIVGFLLTYGAILGPVLAVLVADYFFIRKTHIEMEELYKEKGIYTYNNGFHYPAFIALGMGILLVLIGYWFKPLKIIYDTGWFSGFFLTFIVYILIAKPQVKKNTSSSSL